MRIEIIKLEELYKAEAIAIIKISNDLVTQINTFALGSTPFEAVTNLKRSDQYFDLLIYCNEEVWNEI